ncbi:MCE family protein [Mycolicibacterium celeriflavum]|uniref:MCE family protein n=1 Tax=Mycolicibacterium celeriflavum TaxID=1249101 RepID=UPI0009F560DB|nr:MCE family protein [Mycolicibacterium celeriflavum]MCV7238518.1 MCE family protein [Mycolicibacterium celeriflavum]ORA42403.1 mammalian cell entry protein [Mycolicibacterium celeriflavum]
MSTPRPSRAGWRTRLCVLSVLVLTLCAGVTQVWPHTDDITVTGYFSSAVGLYPGDQVKVAGVPVGTIVSIEPQPQHSRIVMAVRGDVEIPADAHALIIAPNLVSARFVEFAPVYNGGQTLGDRAVIPEDRTAVPVEWDEVKSELTKLSSQLGPQPGSVQGPLTKFVNQAADTFDGQGQSFRQAIRELSQAAGSLGDSRTDLFGTVQNLRILVDALADSNEQVLQFSNRVATVTQVLADSSSDLDVALGTLNRALSDIRGLLDENHAALVGSIDRLTSFTKLLTDHSEDIEQILHVAPHGLANFYNIYSPAQGSLSGLLTLPNFANPVQFICGTFDTGGTADSFKRAEICRQRMAPVLKRITMNYPPMLFHPINSITAYKGQIIYDTPETEAKARTPIAQLQWQPLPGVTPPKIDPGTDLTSLLVPPETARSSTPNAPPVPAPTPPEGER